MNCQLTFNVLVFQFICLWNSNIMENICVNLTNKNDHEEIFIPFDENNFYSTHHSDVCFLDCFGLNNSGSSYTTD